MSKSLKISLAIIIGSFLVFAGAFYWASKEIETIALNIVEEKALISQSSNLAEALAVLKRDSSEADAYKKSIDLLVPSKDQLFVDLLNWLKTQGKAYGVNASFDFQGNEVEPSDNSLGRVGFAMRIDGKLEDIVRFFKNLEIQSIRFLMSFDNFSISRDGGIYRMSTGGYVFFRK